MIKFYFYKNVPKLGNVALSRHAQDRMNEMNMSDEIFQDVLTTGKWIEEGFEILWIEKNNIRIVIILNPTPNTGAKLVKTVINIKPQESSK